MKSPNRQRLATVLAVFVLLAAGLAAAHGHFRPATGSHEGLNTPSGVDLDPASHPLSCPICSFSQQTAPDLWVFKLAPPGATAAESTVASVSLPASLPGAGRSARAPPSDLAILA